MPSSAECTYCILFSGWRLSLPRSRLPAGRICRCHSTYDRSEGCKKVKIRQFIDYLLSVFLNFFTNKKWFFAFLKKFIWLGVGFLNRVEWCRNRLLTNKKCKKMIFYLFKKFKNTSSAQLCGNLPSVDFRAGHFRYFWIFWIIKNDFLHFLSS